MIPHSRHPALFTVVVDEAANEELTANADVNLSESSSSENEEIFCEISNANADAEASHVRYQSVYAFLLFNCYLSSFFISFIESGSFNN